MKDRILSAYVNDFVNSFSLGRLDEPTAFEHFASYYVVSKYNPEDFEPSNVAVGGPGDLGLDSIGILVNDHLVHSNTDVDYFNKALHRLDVQFIFIQAKTSSKFRASEIGNFISGVRQFFESSLPPANEYIQALHELKEYIFDCSVDMDTSPICRLFYVSTGTWADDSMLLTRINQGKSDLEATKLFSSVEFTPVDSDGLKQMYRELNQKVTRGIKFEKHTILPTISGVKEAYIGILPCLEYLNLICDDDGNLNRRLFYDNVRDFRGINVVNQEIEATVRDVDRNDRFALLNNGVTIVARDKNNVGATFRLSDYQIVNGCQTSHVLHLNREHLTENVFLPIKLIVTTDPEVINQIIQGTNRQTALQEEAFESLTPFQKELEEFYKAVGRNRQDQIYYERRSRQYEQENIEREQIIKLANQVYCFVAMFLNEPDSSHRYYGELLNSNRSRLFKVSHDYMPYFLAGASLKAIERLISSEIISQRMKRYKFQFLMVFRIMNEPFDLPRLNSREIDDYCQALLEILDDPLRNESAFRRASAVIFSCESNWGSTRRRLERNKAFTNLLKAEAEKQSTKSEDSAMNARFFGTVKKFDSTLGYGSIAGDDEKEYFVHIDQISSQARQLFLMGERVEFTPYQTEQGPVAIDVGLSQ